MLDASPQMRGMMIAVLQDAGFHAIAADLHALTDGRNDIRAFVAQARPDIVIYDIAYPYAPQWAVFQQVQAMAGLKPGQWIVVTTNPTALALFVGAPGRVAIVGKPFDPEYLIRAVQTALTQG